MATALQLRIERLGHITERFSKTPIRANHPSSDQTS